MINASPKTLILLSAIIWIGGGFQLLYKGVSLIKKAMVIDPNTTMIYVIVIVGILIGLVKNKFIMSKFCVKNINRINNLTNPKIHQFYEAKFFFFLTLMILTGFTLSRLAEGNYSFLLAVATLDFALTTALLTSSRIYFKSKL